MNNKLNKESILNLSKKREVKKQILNLKESNLYFSIYPLHVLIENQIDEILCKSTLSFTDITKIRHSLNRQINLHIRNEFLSYILVHELQIAKKANLVASEDSKYELLLFIQLTGTPDWIEYLFEKYKYLEKRLFIFINNILQNLFNIILRLSIDIVNIQSYFEIPNSRINNIELFLGDSHKGGQSVSKISFSEAAILYKPRNHYSEEEFISLLAYFQNKFSTRIKIPKFITKDNYSWDEFVEISDFQSKDEIYSFFYSHGILIFLCYLLGTKDIIFDNIIASGGDLYLIDLECLLHKHIPFDESLTPFQKKLLESVKEIGILPVWSLGDNFEFDSLSSALFRMSNHEVVKRVWTNNSSSQIELIDQPFNANDSDSVTETEKHLPRFNGEYCEISSEFAEHLISGFSDIYLYCIENKKDIINYINTNNLFKKSFTRLILHSTSAYEQIRNNLLYPEAFQKQSYIRKIKKMLLDTTLSHKHKSTNQRILNSMMQQLLMGDIPYFFTYSDSKTLYSYPDQEVDKNIFIRSKYSQTRVIKKIQELDLQDFKIQQEIINGTIDFYLSKKLDTRKYNLSSNVLNKIDNPYDGFLSAAATIADYLISKSHALEYEINWFSKTKDLIDGKYDFVQMSYDLYSGIAGIAFYMLYMYKFTDDKKYLDIAEKILESEKRHLNELIEKNYFENIHITQKEYSVFVSPFSFPLSILYLNEHFCSINEKYFDEKVLKQCQYILSIILQHNQNFDFVSGLSGALDLFVNLKEHFNLDNNLIDNILSKLVAGAKKVNENTTWTFFDAERGPGLNNNVALGGFGHGTAGISNVLLKVSHILQRPDLQLLAIQALEYDRSLFNDKIQGWVDNRYDDYICDFGYWCNGSAGIALSRILGSQYYMDSMIESEIRIAANNIVSKGMLNKHFLCHGDLSNIEILMLCGHFLKDEKYIDIANKWIKTFFDKFVSGNLDLSFSSGQMEMLGLFNGLAGIGYTFLRFHDWENMPSILCLEPSKTPYKDLHKS